MTNPEDEVSRLQKRLDDLVRTQISFQHEITDIRRELEKLRLKNRPAAPEPFVPPARTGPTPPGAVPPNAPPRAMPPGAVPPNSPPGATPPAGQAYPFDRRPPAAGAGPHRRPPAAAPAGATAPGVRARSGIEEYIGENLLSKIGILVLVIGFAIGAKYAIDRDLISPTARIALGYAGGFALLALAFRLRAKYHNFSAVLLSGGAAILYFITFFAHDLYGLIGQSTAFAMMAVLTVFTVAAALRFDRQIIAHLGLVGAYAVPFLLSDGSGRDGFLLGYIAVINLGILAVSLGKYWKPLFYTSFALTWLIYFAWFGTRHERERYFDLALFYQTAYFLIFYATFIGYKLRAKTNIAAENVGLILSNSLIYYVLGYLLLAARPETAEYLGLFTVANAGLHFAVGATVSRLRVLPDDLVYLTAALVITFATAAIPVQLDGRPVTIVWAVEAAALFWIGRQRGVALFEYFSFPVMALAFFRLLYDWTIDQQLAAQLAPRASVLLTALVFVAAAAVVFFVNRDEDAAPPLGEDFRRQFGRIVAAVALFALYNAFRMEIDGHFEQLAAARRALPTADFEPAPDPSAPYLLNFIWQINYTLFFVAALAAVNLLRVKSRDLGLALLGLLPLAVVLFLTAGLFAFSELRENYLLATAYGAAFASSFALWGRYLGYAFWAAATFALWRTARAPKLRALLPAEVLELLFDAVLYGSLLVIASSELLNLMDIYGVAGSYKLGLSILWGVYALWLIGLGIYAAKRHLRFAAIALFAVTLGKVFLYDIADLDTISKTIVFVALGGLLLIVSFLYTKYKTLIFGSDAEKNRENV